MCGVLEYYTLFVHLLYICVEHLYYTCFTHVIKMYNQYMYYMCRMHVQQIMCNTHVLHI